MKLISLLVLQVSMSCDLLAQDISPVSQSSVSNVEAAEKLINDHLPELRELVQTLRKRAPKEYEKAIRDLARSSQKLEVQKRRDTVLYDLDVQVLRAQMTVDLTTAQLQLNDRPKLHGQLREAISDRTRLRLARLERQRELATKRLTSTQAELDRLEQRILYERSNTDAQAQRDYEQLIRRAEQARQRNATHKET